MNVGTLRLLLIFTVTILVAFGCCQKPKRDPAVRASFAESHPCPANMQRRGACPGYQVDHIEPICAGGLDSPSNMQWLSIDEHRQKTAIDIRRCRELNK